jgi:branched-chain amino acid transport system permease protein
LPHWFGRLQLNIAGQQPVTPISAAFHENGIFLGLKGFAAAVAGGLGNPLGAVVGGLVIGMG